MMRIEDNRVKLDDMFVNQFHNSSVIFLETCDEIFDHRRSNNNMFNHYQQY